MALSRYQQRMIGRYRSFLDAARLSESEALERMSEDPAAIVPVFRLMTDQVVRSVVILSYTFVDQLLNHEIHKHFFGPGDRLRRARRTKKFRTLQLMLQQTFLLQKLVLVEQIRNVPRSISTNIRALNDLRNGMAHAFFLNELPTAKRTFKSRDVFSIQGLEFFQNAMREIDHYFMPYLADYFGVEDEGEKAN